MKTLEELQKITRQGLEILKRETGLIEGLVYASANERTIGRIFYTSHLPSTGLEEPKSDSDYGVAVELWFEKDGKKLSGMGYEPNDLSINAVKRAIDKAKRDAVEDKEFYGFLKKKELPKIDKPYSPNLQRGFRDKNFPTTQRFSQKVNTTKAESELLVKLSWETIAGALDTIAPYAKKHKMTPKKAAFILNGDNFLIRERMALATTNGIVESDESQVILAFITAMLERENAKGSAWGAQAFVNSSNEEGGKSQTIKFNDKISVKRPLRVGLDDRGDFSAYQIGKEAALAAINGVGSIRVPSKKYRVVFGHQAVAELFGSLLSPHVNLAMVDLGASLFVKKYAEQIASPLLTLYDDGALPGGVGNKRITCEGYPAGKTLLIDSGKLIGYLSDSRTTNKLRNNPEKAKMVLGFNPHKILQAITPRNGFRFGGNGGRIAAVDVGIHPTNLVVDSVHPVTPKKLLKTVDEGIFIGRLWYTYPVGGYASGIISGTAIADCYTIRNGRLAKPITPNSLRLEDNLGEMIKRIIGIADNQRPTLLWASDEITYAPWVAMDSVQFFAINQ